MRKSWDGYSVLTSIGAETWPGRWPSGLGEGERDRSLRVCCSTRSVSPLIMTTRWDMALMMEPALERAPLVDGDRDLRGLSPGASVSPKLRGRFEPKPGSRSKPSICVFL